jgi:hypothetical protein
VATTDLYTVVGSLNPTRHALRFLGGDVDDGVQVDALAAAIVAANHTKGTISAWIMVPDDSGTYSIFGAGDANVAEYMHFQVVAGKLRFVVYDGGATQVQIDSTSRVVPIHTWTHVALVQDGSRPYFFVNGEKVAVTDTTATSLGDWFALTDGIDGAHIGASDSVAGLAALTNEFKGYISDVKVWSGTAATAALTCDQIKNDFRGVTNTTSLLAHYKFDGDVVNRANEGTYDGTVVGALIYSDANEFASRLTFGAGTVLVADSVLISTSNGMGFALVIQAA